VTYQHDVFDAAQDIYINQRFGCDGIWDLGVIASTTHSARTNDIWESLTCVDPANNSDIGVVRTTGLGSTTFTVCTLTSTFLDWVQSVAAGRAVYYRYDTRHPFIVEIENPKSESNWNISAASQLKALMCDKTALSRGLPVLPEIVSVTDHQDTVLRSARKPDAMPMRDTLSRQNNNVADPTVGSSMSAGGIVDGQGSQAAIEQITAGESFGDQGRGSGASGNPSAPPNR
jgi:hypothetical protein